MRSSLSLSCALVTLLLLASSLCISARPSPSFSDLAMHPRLAALSTSRAHHPTLLPTSLPSSPSTTAWYAPLTPPSALPPPSPCPISRPWNLSLSPLPTSSPIIYRTCQFLSITACDSPDDCPAFLTAVDYANGSVSWTLPYSNSSNDLPLGESILVSAYDSHFYVQRGVNDSCNSLTGYVWQGGKVGETWTASFCVQTSNPILLFTFMLVPIKGAYEHLLWWAVTTDDSGEYVTHYTVYQRDGQLLHPPFTLPGGVQQYEELNDDGFLLATYILNKAQVLNATVLEAWGNFSRNAVVNLTTPALRLPAESETLVLYNFTALWGYDVVFERVSWITQRDEILFAPYGWYALYDGFQLVYTSFEEYAPMPEFTLVVAVAENADLNQLIAIAAIYDSITGHRQATSRVIGPVEGDGKTILLQFAQFADDGQVPVLFLGHRWFAINATSLEGLDVVAEGDKPGGELTSYTEFVSSVNRTAFSTITLTAVDQYTENFQGQTVVGNRSTVAVEEDDAGQSVRQVRVASE